MCNLICIRLCVLPVCNASLVVLLLCFILIVIVRPLSVYLWHFVHFCNGGHLLGKSDLFSLPLMPFYTFNFSVVLTVCGPFPFGSSLQIRMQTTLGVFDRMWNSIIWVPDHCSFNYLLWPNLNDEVLVLSFWTSTWSDDSNVWTCLDVFNVVRQND